MAEIKIRKIVVSVEETHREAGRAIAPPTRKAVAAAVIENPFAGEYVEDLEPLIAMGEELGGLLSERARDALGAAPGDIQSYGKAAIVGEAGELEHTAALIHPRYGRIFRENVEKGDAAIPSTKKRGGPGTRIDVPLHYKNEVRVRSHFDAVEVSIPDAPMANEVVVIAAVTDSGRPLPRIGGTTPAEVEAGSS